MVGKWLEDGGTDVLEFYKDNTATVVNKGKSSVGEYKFTSNRDGIGSTDSGLKLWGRHL